MKPDYGCSHCAASYWSLFASTMLCLYMCKETRQFNYEGTRSFHTGKEAKRQ